MGLCLSRSAVFQPVNGSKNGSLEDAQDAIFHCMMPWFRGQIDTSILCISYYRANTSELRQAATVYLLTVGDQGCKPCRLTKAVSMLGKGREERAVNESTDLLIE